MTRVNGETSGGMGDQEELMTAADQAQSRLFVRNSTGLVRSASAVDATIFNAVISAPIGSTLAWSIFFTLVAFPGADPVGVLIIAAIINIPVLIMFALLGASMPRVGGDYVWVSRMLNPPRARGRRWGGGGPPRHPAARADLEPVHDHGRPARCRLLRQVLLGLRPRPGAGRGREPGPQQHAGQLGQLVPDRQGLDPGRGPGH